MHKLPYNLDLENKEILKALNKANNKLGELNGIVKTLPNPLIFLYFLNLSYMVVCAYYFLMHKFYHFLCTL